MKCETFSKCVAYTYEEAGPRCILHSSNARGLKFTPGKQTGVKRGDFVLSFLEMSFCFEKRRKRRCRREPNCDHVHCLRIASNHFASLKPFGSINYMY